ncbi:2OG-Fe(II) oxygenase [Streptomyces sp. NRRL S-87]|uniref:2OG-Fe(II) oxygenase n=1 Tax=Streptomyces sp. NRRL S-87 TaxID=1463920 RepID=UPI000AA49A5A|nr:2OG-Fe(II) oxygenase [Streptomyces sp. NRRL S-87]
MSEWALFDLAEADPTPAGPPVGGPVGWTAADWERLYGELDERGAAVTPPLLTPAECAELAATFERRDLFRSTVEMDRHGYGRGTYRYYADPDALPLVRRLREELYPGLARAANRWARLLGEPAYPDRLAALHARCAERGQLRPTPLILRYGPGGYAALHQDVYGELVFPLQVSVLLSDPEADFTGGESVFVEQRPRAQSRAVVVRPGLGQGVVFPVRERPVHGPQGVRRHAVRHGSGEVGHGVRYVLGVIFHHAR